MTNQTATDLAISSVLALLAETKPVVDAAEIFAGDLKDARFAPANDQNWDAFDAACRAL